jgi:hypothetical protein
LSKSNKKCNNPPQLEANRLQTTCYCVVGLSNVALPIARFASNAKKFILPATALAAFGPTITNWVKRLVKK